MNPECNCDNIFRLYQPPIFYNVNGNHKLCTLACSDITTSISVHHLLFGLQFQDTHHLL